MMRLTPVLASVLYSVLHSVLHPVLYCIPYSVLLRTLKHLVVFRIVFRFVWKHLVSIYFSTIRLGTRIPRTNEHRPECTLSGPSPKPTSRTRTAWRSTVTVTAARAPRSRCDLPYMPCCKSLDLWRAICRFRSLLSYRGSLGRPI